MRKTLCLLLAVLAGQSFALEVHLAKTIDPPSRLFQVGREYAFTTNGTPDDRLFFVAYQYQPGLADGCWILRIFPRSEDISFDAYLEAIRACAERFAADIPDGKVCEVTLELPHNGELWTDLRAKLVPILEVQKGMVNVEFPKDATRRAREYIKSSPRLQQIAAEMGEKLKVHPRKVHAEGAIFLARPQLLGKHWQELLRSPDLGSRPIAVIIEFETAKDAGR